MAAGRSKCLLSRLFFGSMIAASIVACDKTLVVAVPGSPSTPELSRLGRRCEQAAGPQNGTSTSKRILVKDFQIEQGRLSGTELLSTVACRLELSSTWKCSLHVCKIAEHLELEVVCAKSCRAMSDSSDFLYIFGSETSPGGCNMTAPFACES